jgi:DNA-binding CsgD family transcriptional regulator
MPSRISNPTLVGRSEELAALLESVRRAAERQCSVVLLKGDAGIGKTRLVQELERAPECRETLRLRGACVDFGGEELAYAPIVAALRTAPTEMLLNAARSLPPVMGAELARLMPTLAIADDEADRDPSRGAQGRLYEYLLELIRRLGDSAPVLLVLEDLHWADQSTLDFLAFVARNGGSQRLTVIGTYRLHDRRRTHAAAAYWDELERAPGVEPIVLTPLSPSEVGVQMSGILGAAPHSEVLERVVARAQGNPFYVEELLAASSDAGAQLPPGQLAALRLRVQRLPTDSRELARTLAAFGRPVTQELLGAAADVGEPALSTALRPAFEEHVIARHGDRELGFRHALTREAVYEDLLPGERQALHARVAQALYDRPELTDAAELAVQWREAGDEAAALAASLAAAEAAVDVYAYAEAVEHYRVVLGLWRPATARGLDRDRAGVLLDAADAARCAGVEQLPIDWCLEGLDILGDGADPARVATFYERLGRYQDHHLDRSLMYYGRALESLPAGPSAERARLVADEALALMLGVRYTEARQRSAEALDVAVAAGARAEEGVARAVLGLVLSYLGQFDEGEMHLEAARRIEEELARPDELCRVYVHLGEARRLRGDTRGALAVMEAGAVTAQRLGVGASYGRYLSLNAAEDLFDLGDWTEAQRRLDALEAVALTWSETLLHHTVSGQLAMARGDFPRATTRLHKARDHLRADSVPEFVAYVAAAVAELEVVQGATEEALANVEAQLTGLRGKEDCLYTPALFAIGARAAAEVAERARVRRRLDAASSAVGTAERQLARFEELLDSFATPAGLAYLSSARAELERGRGASDPDLWAAAAERWERLEHRYRGTYARYRQADALVTVQRDRKRAAAVLALAREEALRLGATRLCEEIDALAARARLKVEAGRPPGGAAGVDGDASFGLTDRELAVLELMIKGCKNKEIAQELVISVGTARTHVSNIMRKLGAHTRTEAAGMARLVQIGASPTDESH